MRGYRIELGEIETALRQERKVRDAVVLVRESAGGNQELVAYLAAEINGKEANLINELKTSLRNKLPAYMIPAQFVLLAEFPLTPNGKIDRRALPAPDRSRPETAEKRALPRDATEEQLVSIWQNGAGDRLAWG